MKTKSVYILLIVACSFLTSCNEDSVRASREISVRSFSFSDYTALEIANDFNAYITFSDTEEKIQIETNENLQEFVIVKMVGNKLTIKLKDNINIRGKETLNIYMTTKFINDYAAYGDARITLENTLDAANAKITLAGDSYFTGKILADDLDLDIKGDSKIDIYGNVHNLYAEVYGDSKLEDYDLFIDNLDIELYGDSKAYLTVLNTLSIEASGDSSLFYKGNASIVRQRLTGDSSLVRRD